MTAFYATVIRENHSVKAFYIGADGSRTPSGLEFYFGDVLKVVEVKGDPGADPAGYVWKVEHVNSEGVVGYHWIQPIMNDWGRRPNLTIASVAVLNPEQKYLPPLDPAKYTHYLVVVPAEGLKIYQTANLGGPIIELAPQGLFLKSINEPDLAEVEYRSPDGTFHPLGYAKMTYVAPALATGQYYQGVVRIIIPELPDPEPEPEPENPGCSKILADIWAWIQGLFEKKA